jgi:Cd2+/Zn2+-exporting ATPase
LKSSLKYELIELRSLEMVVLLIPLTILGIAHIGPAVIDQEGSTLQHFGRSSFNTYLLAPVKEGHTTDSII